MCIEAYLWAQDLQELVIENDKILSILLTMVSHKGSGKSNEVRLFQLWGHMSLKSICNSLTICDIINYKIILIGKLTIAEVLNYKIEKHQIA